MVQVILLLLAVCVSTANSYNLVAAPKGTCTQKLASAAFEMTPSQCGIWLRPSTIGHGYFLGLEWIPLGLSVVTALVSEYVTAQRRAAHALAFPDCHMDLCKIPSSGRVASSSVWGIDQKQESNITSSSRNWGIIKMIRSDCVKIGGRYFGWYSTDLIYCRLYFIKKDGSNRRNIDMLVLSSVGKCSRKVARGIVRTQQHTCSLIGGDPHRNLDAYEWTDCDMDICLSPVIQCKPSDSWKTIATFRNPSSLPMSCSFKLTTGIEEGSSTGTGTGGSTSITAEVGFELEGLFSATISSTTGYNWSSTRGSHRIWRKETSLAVKTELKPNSAVSIVQVVGSCGNFHVATPEYKQLDVPLLPLL